MKSLRVGLISSLLLALAIGSRVEAFEFPNIKPDPDAPSYLFYDGVTPFTFIKRGETTGGQYTIGEVDFKPGQGSLPHFHQDEDEWFYVEAGNLEVMVGDNTYNDPNLIPGVNAPRDILHALNAPAGTLIYAPRYHIHGVINASDTPAKLRLIWNPSGFEDIFKQPGIISISDLNNPPPAPPDYLAIFVRATSTRKDVSSFYYDQFGDIQLDNKLANEDNQAERLLRLLGQSATPVPESSSPWYVLAFGALAAISILKRQRKSSLSGELSADRK